MTDEDFYEYRHLRSRKHGDRIICKKMGREYTWQEEEALVEEWRINGNRPLTNDEVRAALLAVALDAYWEFDEIPF